MIAHALPEWRVFVRFPGGQGRYFTVTHRHQMIALAVLAAIGAWAAGSNLMLMRQPAEIAQRVQELETQIADLKAEEARLAATHKVVADLTREVHDVHSSLQVLTDASAELTKDREQNGKTLAPAQLQPTTQDAADPILDQPIGPHESSAVAVVRNDLRGLRQSLDRLRASYVSALSQTAAMADQSAISVEKTLNRLGVDADAVANQMTHGRGRGGPFIPLLAGRGDGTPGDSPDEQALANLLSRLDHWNDVKIAVASLPLAEPLHESWEVNSQFGARNDPVNEQAGIHEGLDMGAPYGTPVYATGAGRIVMAGPYDRYGLTVDVDHGGGFVTRYAHLSQIKVQVGQKVTRATVVGLLGATGRVTGAHLHYEVRFDDTPQNPLKYITVGRDASTSR